MDDDQLAAFEALARLSEEQRRVVLKAYSGDNAGATCWWCGLPADLLCDSVLSTVDTTETCDAPMCSTCAAEVGRGTVCGSGGCEAFVLHRCPYCTQRRLGHGHCVTPFPGEHRAAALQHGREHPSDQPHR